MVQQTVNTCGTAIATCSLGAWMIDIILPAFVLIASAVWLSLNIGWFLWTRYKEWKKS